MAGLAGQAFTVGGFVASLSAFGAAALTYVALIFALALLIATAQEGIIAAIQAHLTDVKRWGGRILVGVGVWFITLGLFASFFSELFF